MQIKKILLVPSSRVVEPEHPWLDFTKRVIMSKGKILLKKSKPAALALSGELAFYGGIPEILGKENTFMFGDYRPHSDQDKVPQKVSYVSCYGAPEVTHISRGDIKNTMKEIDAVLISVRADSRRKYIIKQARQAGKPIAMIDFHDQPSIYGSKDKISEMYYDFEPGKDFDLFFKKDLPLGYKSNILLPLAPAPIRPELYDFPQKEKDIDIYYSGFITIKANQPERKETVEVIQKNFKNTKLIDYKQRSDFLPIDKYWEYLSRTKISLSPTGISWDSFRHADTSLANDTLLVCPEPFIATTGPELKDGHNAVLYQTEIDSDGKRHLKDPEELVKKLKYYLDHPEERKKVARQWSQDVLDGHTRRARSQYILDSIAKFVK